MNLGKFKHILTFKELNDEPTNLDFNDHKEVFKTRGNVQFLKGKNFYDSLTNNELITATILIRKRKNINSDMIILFKNYVFNIESITPDDTERYLLLRVSQTSVDR